MNAVQSDAKAIFLEALEYAAPDERAKYLDAACVTDATLRARVDALLAAHDHAGQFLRGHAADAAAPDEPTAEQPGAIIGPYKLLEQIGEGGFGVVFLAEQEKPLRRRVALKVVKPGMDTREVIARFEAERQALALMDHPNIAKVLDAGTTGAGSTEQGAESTDEFLLHAPRSPLPAASAGRPFFVMELVQGVPITEYCDQCNLTTGERLELFVTVCQAVQHAHQKGIIHRDLKPNNVLVAGGLARFAESAEQKVPVPLSPEKPLVKIIDFGVAKAIGEQTLTERTLTTAFAQMVGTPMYMSPEQAELSPLGVDTRSDIYSLGVMLYELLAGATPFDKDRLHAASYDELRRIIREEEPPRPSARLSSLSLGERAGVRETAQLVDTIAEKRRTDARRLIQSIRGELDWIVMKCLEKDRNRRYDSAGNLARDVERYLADEPVQACPPSGAYRMRKFVRRNKVAVAFMALLTGGVAALAVSNVMIQSALTQKDAALALALTNEQRATKEARRAQTISNFLSDMLASSYPNRIKDSQYTVRELLDDSTSGLGELAGQREVEAAVRSVIGRCYWRLGVFDRAELHLKQALDLNRRVFGANDERVADSLIDYAWNLGDQGRIAEAEACAREAVSIYEQLAPNPQVTTSLAEALYLLTVAQLRQGDKAGYRATCKALAYLPVRSDNVITNSRPVWPLCLAPDALDDMSRPVKRAERLVEESSSNDRHFNLYVLGAALYRAGRYEQAAQRFEESIDAYPGIPIPGADTLNYQRLLLAMTRWKQGREEEARRLLAEAQPAVDKELHAPSTRWNRRTSLELLRDEAEAMIEPKEAADDVENEGLKPKT